MSDEVKEIETRMEILKKTDGRLAFILDFNKRLATFNQVTPCHEVGPVQPCAVQCVEELEAWLLEGRKKLDSVKSPTGGTSTDLAD